MWYPSCPSVNLIYRWPYEPSFLPPFSPSPPLSSNLPIFFHFTSLHLFYLPSPIFTLCPPSWKLIHTYLLLFIPPPSLPPLRPIPSPHQDHDKTQEEVLKHQASISQLKRSFMEAPPPSPPQLNQWEKRLTSSPATIRIQPQQVVCLSAASKKMHDFSGDLSGICLGICTKTIYFLMGMLQRNVFLTPAVLLLFQWCVTVGQWLVTCWNYPHKTQPMPSISLFQLD